MSNHVEEAKKIESKIKDLSKKPNFFLSFFTAKPDPSTIAELNIEAAQLYSLASDYTQCERSYLNAISLYAEEEDYFKVSDIYKKLQAIFSDVDFKKSIFYAEESIKGYLKRSALSLAAQGYSQISAILERKLKDVESTGMTKKEIIEKIIEYRNFSYKFYKDINSSFTAHSELISKGNYLILHENFEEAMEAFIEVIKHSEDSTSRFRDIKICLKIHLLGVILMKRNKIDSIEEILMKINKFNSYYCKSNEAGIGKNIEGILMENVEEALDEVCDKNGLDNFTGFLLSFIKESVMGGANIDEDLC